MCGLTGYLDVRHPPEGDVRLVMAMADALRHRGPDAGGAWSEGPVALGHRRLSILDLSPEGAQPMASQDGRLVLAYNGEIYNHLDLRADLAREGRAPAWRGHSDTETLLAAIAAWGLEEALAHAYGMFALALWDRRAGSLALARDRMGEKPLYYGWAEGTLIFGSEIKALAVHPSFDGRIAPAARALYLRHGYVPAPHAIHHGLYKLEPGVVMHVTDVPSTPPARPPRPGDAPEGMVLRRYWSIEDEVARGAADPIEDATEAADALEATLARAVARQTISDVPLGAFLSGGVDSSTIVALMRAHQTRPVRTFTIGFDLPQYDESAHAAAVARHLGTEHHEMRITEADARAMIPDLPALYDEVFADSSQIPTHLVCRAARAQVTVALSGDGGDELFGGYNRYFWGPHVWSRFAWMPQAARRGLGWGLRAMPPDAWDWLGGGRVVGLGAKVHRLGARLRDVRNMDGLYRSLVSEWDPAEILAEPPPEAPSPLDDPFPARGATEPPARMMLQDMRSYLPDDILCKVDRAAMGISLETRAPFLDPEVVRLSTRIALPLKIDGLTGKAVLRDVLYRHVPRTLIERPKAGFAIPVGVWMRGPLRDWAEELLAPARLAEAGLRPEPVRAVWAAHLSGRDDATPRLWSILMLQAWHAANDA